MLDDLIEQWTGRVGRTMACVAFGVNERSNRHRRQNADGRARPRAAIEPRERRPHPARLSDSEKEQIVTTLCEERFCDLAPAQVYTTLLDEATYLCSERQMYRVLAERGLVRERRRGHVHASYTTPRLVATKPNQVWTWDITALRGPTKGVKYFLYTILDIFSRKTVGWALHESESEKHARRLIRETCKRYGIDPKTLTIHADRGGPMIYIEAHFKTLKYRPDYPARFDSLNHARTWCRQFFTWYNEIHYHSGIGYLRPADLHDGIHTAIIERRQATLDRAHATHPERFTKPPRPANAPAQAWINKPTIQTT
jgi:putative transposase